MTIRFEVSGKPIPKARARVGRCGGYTPKATSDYTALVAMSARCALAKWQRDHGRTWDTSRTYMLLVTVVPYQSYAQRKRGYEARMGDWDNYGKLVSDACNGILWMDDKRVAFGGVLVGEACTRPGIVVHVETMRRPHVATPFPEWREER